MLKSSILLLVLLFAVPTMVSATSGYFAVTGDTLHFPDGTSVKTAPKDGKSVLSGSGAPAMITNIGDFYIDTTINKLYGPYIGSWGSGISLVGPQGATGTKGDTGTSPWGLSGNNTYYSAGKVGIGITTPSSTLEVNGDLIRTISRVYGTDGSGLALVNAWQDVPNRTITYVKKASDTALRITYSDQRIFSAAANAVRNGLMYEIIIDGASCPSGELTAAAVVNSNPTNSVIGSDPSTQIKSCFGLTAGSHIIKVRAMNTGLSGTLTAYFGSNAGIITNTFWAIEVEEVR